MVKGKEIQLRTDEPAEMMKTYNIITSESSEMEPGHFISVARHSEDFVLSVPHSGLLVPYGIEKCYSVSDKTLIEVDMHTDKVFAQNTGTSVRLGLLRTVLDVNRRWSGEKCNVPRHLSASATEYLDSFGKCSLVRPLSPGDLKTLKLIYDLYHSCLRDAIKEVKDIRGPAFLLDGHSLAGVGLPGEPDAGDDRRGFIIGNLGGKSAHPMITKAFGQSLEESAENMGTSVGYNWPYSGGFITRMHSDPCNGVHGIQLEVNKDLYMHDIFGSEPHKHYSLKRQELRKVNSAIKNAILCVLDIPPDRLLKSP